MPPADQAATCARCSAAHAAFSACVAGPLLSQGVSAQMGPAPGGVLARQPCYALQHPLLFRH
eukprot:6536399-Alexandrium_andersonii.AAC.1